jgi:hypothetical protein
MSKLPFGKKNYQWMITGVVMLVIGFTIMSMDTQPYGFGFLGLTLGPIVVLSGFIIEIFAILHNPQKENK